MELLSANQESFFTQDHKTLAYFLHAPGGKEDYPLVMASHGFGGSKEGPNAFNHRLGKALIEKGIGLLSYDFQGCGNSSGSIKNLELQDFQEDFLDMFRLAKERCMQQKAFLAIQATSFGGLISSLCASHTHDSIKGLAYIVPVAYGKTWLPIYEEVLKALSDDDPLPFYNQVIKRSFAKDFLQARGDLSFEKYLTPLPSLLVYAEKDEVVPEDHALSYRELAPRMHVEKVMGADHSFLHEKTQDSLLQHLIGFYQQLFYGE